MTEADRTSELCRFCGLTKDSGTSGSITQYIRTCVCSLGKEEGNLEDILDICLRCKKHIGKGRKGSFTQYIFRSELCDCPEPLSLAELEQETEDPSELSKKSGKNFEEAELDLDPAKFPLDRYIPLLELGRGASGIVYLARDRRLQKRVAIKVLTSSDQNQLLAFQEEAKNTSKLNNPYIVRILDFGIAGGSYPYMVLEYLQGISLEEYLKEHGPLAPEAARNLFVQLCLALEYAHDGGIFHRDLKPSNVILVGTTLEDCRVKLIDFGVAKTKQDSMEPTIIQGRTVVGTPAYMSPDQVQGRAYDARSEIYSLGCLMFETLTGIVPYEGDTALEILRKHAEEEPPDLSQYLDPEDLVNASLIACVNKCLLKDPEQRYQSIKELERDLTPAPAELPYSQNRDNRHNTRRASLTILSIILIGIIISIPVSAILFSNKNHEISNESDSIEITTEKINSGEAGYTTGDFYRASVSSTNINRLTIQNLYKKIDSLKAEEKPSPKKRRVPLQLNLSSWHFKKGDIKQLATRPVDKLILEDSNFDDSMTEDLVKLPLSYLNLRGTQISDRGLAKILKLKNLNYLNLTDCGNLSEECLNNISQCKNLQILVVPPYLISDRTAPYLADCKALRVLDLKNSSISEIGLRILAKSDSLEELRLANNPNLDLKALDIISTDFKNLRALEITDRNLNPEFFKNLGNSQKLRTLYLYGCDVNAQLLKAIASNRRLMNLAIGETSVTGQELLCLQECSGLVYLNLVHAPNLKREDILKLQEKLKGYLTVIAPQISKLDNVEYIMFGEGATSSQSQKKNK